jgi:hypothetical protein
MLLDLILYSLVCFRLSEMLVIDDGPFDAIAELRGWFNRAPFDNSLRRNIANALSCVYCTGVWVAFGLGVVYHLTHESGIIQSLIFSLAVAGLQSVLSDKFGRTINQES